MARKIIGGVEHIILRVDQWGGFESIDVEKLTAKMNQIFSEEALKEMEADMPAGFRGLSFLDVIRADRDGKDRMGWKQHRHALEEEGF